MENARSILASFDTASMPNMDTTVLGALELFAEEPTADKLPEKFTRPLVVGSVNAYQTGRILFADTNAVFANESTYQSALDRVPDIDGAILISASGGKHAVSIAETLQNRKIPAVLITNNPTPPAANYLPENAIVVLPKNREPYTYNTSTYLGMILAKTNEDPVAIKAHIEDAVAARVRDDFDAFNAYTFIVPAEFSAVTDMIETKFDELFGPFVVGRAFTEEEIKHAKTVVSSKEECFISIGVENKYYGMSQNRLSIPLPERVGYGAVLAISYYLVGAIQKQQYPYFMNNIVEYTKRASEIFGQKIEPIVE